MHQSSTYETYLRLTREGRLDEARRIVRRQGTQKFGEPDEVSTEALDAIGDLERLEALTDRLLQPDIRSWADLLNGA